MDYKIGIETKNTTIDVPVDVYEKEKIEGNDLDGYSKYIACVTDGLQILFPDNEIDIHFKENDGLKIVSIIIEGMIL